MLKSLAYLLLVNPLIVHVSKPNGDTPTVHPHMLRMEAGRELTWGGGVRGIFYGEHVFLLEETMQQAAHISFIKKILWELLFPLCHWMQLKKAIP